MTRRILKFKKRHELSCQPNISLEWSGWFLKNTICYSTVKDVCHLVVNVSASAKSLSKFILNIKCQT